MKLAQKMQIHIQFHGSESTQNSLNPGVEKHIEGQSRDGLDKMIHGVQNSLGCQALLAFSVSSSFTRRHTAKEYWSGELHSHCEFSNYFLRILIFRKDLNLVMCVVPSDGHGESKAPDIWTRFSVFLVRYIWFKYSFWNLMFLLQKPYKQAHRCLFAADGSCKLFHLVVKSG